MEQTSPHRDNDISSAGELLLGLAITLFALLVIEESLRMPPRGHLGVLCYPSFVPLLTGSLVLVLSLVLNISSWRKGGHRQLRAWWHHAFHDEENQRFLVILAAMLLYTVVLLGRVHFIIATLVFHLAAFVYLRVGSPLKIGFYAALATLLVAVFLPWVFEMPIP